MVAEPSFATLYTAMSKPNEELSSASDETLRHYLITRDYVGKEVKAQALDELIRRARAPLVAEVSRLKARIYYGETSLD